MKRIIEKVTRTKRQSNIFSEVIIAIPRIFCGLILAFGFGASKFGMPWSPTESNLALFHVSKWFVEDVENFGGLFANFPVLFAWLAAASETVGALFLVFGFKTRIASFFLMTTMLVAVFFQQWDNGLWAMLPALGFLWVMIYSLVMGSGRFGLDYIIHRRLESDRILTMPVSDTTWKLRTTGSVLILLFGFSLNGQEKTVSLQLDTRDLQDVKTVSLRGNIAPLSESQSYQLIDSDADGVYDVKIKFKTSKKNVKFKFLVNGIEELKDSDPRVIWLKDEPVAGRYIYNEYNYYAQEEIGRISYTSAQIEEDVAILKKIVQYVHPNIYKYRDSLELQADFELLEADMKGNPSINNCYGAISKFAAKVKCSHTFTNPWNQSSTMEKANFYQPDKIPFTFNRIGRRLFIDKNASDNTALKKGLEITYINETPTAQVLTELADYVTSDGNNYEKKLERLLVTGEEKFSMFDIFYPIAFGSKKQFVLALRDITTGEEFTTKVTSISKTKRSQKLGERYGNLKSSLEEGWTFEIINDDVARLSISSFAVQRNEFDWKAYLDDVFKQLSGNSIPNLVIDIRGNEGGQGIVGKYILERVIQKPFKVNAMQSSVRYLEIPSGFKKYISTWDKFPYDFSGKVSSEREGRYYLKDRYVLKGSTMKPKRGHFKGRVFLITDASNSSATHLMAAYAKQIENVTIVGQETGGNQMGTNGSYMFFLRLPNTRVELDIPVIHNYVLPKQKAEDRGIEPDLAVEKSPQDFINNVDTELNTILNLIKTK